MDFKVKLENEYPIPFVASIFGDPNLTNLDEFVQLCLEDLDSDLEIYESMPATGLWTQVTLEHKSRELQ